MQTLSVGPIELASIERARLQEAHSNKANGNQAAIPMTLPTLWSSELAALKRAQEAHARALMMLVHELRSPAAASKSMVSTLRYLKPEDRQLDNVLARIEGRMDHLLDLVEDILDLSQARAGNPLGSPASLDLVATTSSVCQPYIEEATAKGLEMLVNVPESPIRMEIAERVYQLIVSNLVSNAVKYTRSGAVKVALRQAGRWAVLTVEDTGIGVPQDEICHLFTEFFRATNARESRVRGTGLGLAAVKALVENCGGSLVLQSQEHRGSTVIVQIPLCSTGTAASAEFYPRSRATAQ